jgi:hypothetical protein
MSCFNIGANVVKLLTTIIHSERSKLVFFVTVRQPRQPSVWMTTVSNPLAYYVSKSITAIKSFIVQTQSVFVPGKFFRLVSFLLLRLGSYHCKALH